MAELTITVPETAETPAAEFLEAAARGYGWAPEQPVTAEEAILDQLERDLHYRFRSGATHLSRDEVEEKLPIPESRGQRAHREREEAREAALAADRAAAEAAREAEARGGQP